LLLLVPKFPKLKVGTLSLPAAFEKLKGWEGVAELSPSNLNVLVGLPRPKE
jgi:hypothetical protein